MWLGIAVAATFLLLGNGAVKSSDERAAFETARSAVEEQGLEVSDTPLVGVPGRDGRLVSRYGIAGALLGAPLYAASIPVGDALGDREAVGIVAFASVMPVVTGGLTSALYVLARRLSATRSSSLLVAVGTVFGTYVFTYGREAYAEPLVALALVAAVERMASGRHYAAGAWLGWALAAHVRSFIFVVIVLAAMARARPRDAARAVAGLAPAVLVVLLANFVRFGSPLDTGYEGEGFTNPLLDGVAGLLFDRHSSVLLFAPIVVAGVAGLRATARRNDDVSLAAGGVAIAALVFTATWHSWRGGYAWGPRLLLPAVALLAVAAAPWLDEGRRHVRTLVAVALFTVGFLVSLPTVVAPWTIQNALPAGRSTEAPAIVEQYERIDDAVRHTFDDDGCPPLRHEVFEDDDCTIALWQVQLARATGADGTAVAAIGSAVLATVAIVSWRRTARLFTDADEPAAFARRG